LEIFQDIGESNNKVHGSKDKFNAKSLLSTPIDQIPVSDDEDATKTAVQPVEEAPEDTSFATRDLRSFKGER